MSDRKLILLLWLSTSLLSLLGLWVVDTTQGERMRELSEEVSRLRQAVGARSAPTEVSAESCASALEGVLARRGAIAMQGNTATVAHAPPTAAMQVPAAVAHTEEDEEEQEKPHTPEQRRALEQATQLVDSALSRGRMTREDVMELRAQFEHMRTPEEKQALVQRLVIAINKNQLIPPADPYYMLP